MKKGLIFLLVIIFFAGCKEQTKLLKLSEIQAVGNYKSELNPTTEFITLFSDSTYLYRFNDLGKELKANGHFSIYLDKDQEKYLIKFEDMIIGPRSSFRNESNKTITVICYFGAFNDKPLIIEPSIVSGHYDFIKSNHLPWDSLLNVNNIKLKNF